MTARDNRTRRRDEPASFFTLIERFLLVVCLCILAIRATYLESPHGGMISASGWFTGEAGSMILTGVIMLVVAGWFVLSLFRRRLSYRFSGIELAAVLFAIAGLLAALAASNKRAAITDTLTLLAPMLMAVVLIQLLTNPRRIMLVLLVVVALGIVTTYQCADQLFTSNEEMIADYQQNPQPHLSTIGIEPGSFEQMQYEHRLYGKDIRGFLTTSNSTGSFLLICSFVSVGLFLDQFRRRNDKTSAAAIAALGIAAAVTITGLVIAHSRGALAAAALCALIFVVSSTLGPKLWKYRRMLLLVLLAGILVVSAAVICYGNSHERLPGGTSMFVRWQYWKGAFDVYLYKPFTGVGGGNFADYYPHYKIPAAPETVTDPHNFLLSLLAQYGPMGLLGFVGGFVIVLCRSVFSQRHSIYIQSTSRSFRRYLGTTVGISLVMLLLRPVLQPIERLNDVVVVICAAVILYIIPAVLFAVTLWILCKCLKDIPSENLPAGRATRISLFCGIAAVAVHNLIDFAILEPAVLTLFWTTVACLSALDHLHKNGKVIEFLPSRAARTILLPVAVAVFLVVFAVGMYPVISSGVTIQRAVGAPSIAPALLVAAAEADPLDPEPLSLAGKLYIRSYLDSGKASPRLLHTAAERFQQAILRDKANFRNYEKLAEVYQMLAESSSVASGAEFRSSALDALAAAVERYPGSDRINFKLARLADAMGKTETAVHHYRRTIKIEDAYRTQFVAMYPNRSIFSRLGEDNYRLAKDRLRELSTVNLNSP
jgi:hypothetical protein